MVLPRPALGQMQGEATGLAREASGQGEEAPSEGLGGCHRLAQTDAHGPASQVIRHRSGLCSMVPSGVKDVGLDLLRVLMLGWINERIGDELVVTLNTVRTYLANLRGKLDAETRLQAVMSAVRWVSWSFANGGSTVGSQDLFGLLASLAVF